MLRPERMSRVSVTGTKAVMPAVIEAVHDLNLVHLSSYDGRWEGFAPGDPLGGADETSDRLVTVRAIESILDLEAPDAEPAREAADEHEAELESVRERVNEVDDERAEIRDRLRAVEEARAAAEPFVALGIDLDLLSGYDSLTVRVGEGDAAEVREALEAADAVDAVETFAADGVVAAFAAGPASAVDEALVGATFTAVSVPDAEGPPDAYVADLERERRELAERLEALEGRLDELAHEAGRFLLAMEERLTVEVQKAEAPLSFATTEHAFVAEGWIPSDQLGELRTALDAAAGDRVELEELERAEYDREGVPRGVEAVTDEGEPSATGGPSSEVVSDGGERTDGSRASSDLRADGGHDLRMDDGGPPVVLDNPGPIRPYQLLTDAVGRPSYSEVDPTVILFLTFPLMFGFMIGDVGYGVIYTGIGYYIYKAYDSDALRDFGYIALSAGLLTVLFGVLYGEVFGLHLVTDFLWEPLLGHPPLEKGLSPASAHWAEAWFVVTAIFGVVHLSIGYAFEFVENYALHGFKEAMLETGSWLIALDGFWLFVFSRGPAADTRPALLFSVFGRGEEAVLALGFSGFPVWVGWVGVAMVAVGAALLLAGPTHEIIEFHVILAHAVSYLRIAAVLLAKAGMAFAVNLFFFGAYEEHGEFHFMLTHGPAYVSEHAPEATVMFPGLLHGGTVAVVGGIVVLLIGHLVVLALGVTSAGIQSIRLEYFEFFSKFYDGGGTPYSPFGYGRRFEADQ